MQPLFSDNSPLGQNPQPKYQAPQSLQQPQQIYMAQPINPVSVGMQRDLLDVKKLYDQTNKAIQGYNAQLAGEGLSDDDRRTLTTLRDNAQNSLPQLSSAADTLRSTASNLGIDMSGFGADNTLEESSNRMLFNNMQGQKDLLNLPNVYEQQRAYYEMLRNQGLSPRLARRAAAEEMSAIRENYNQQLSNGIMSYGKNEDGSLNAFGVAMIGKMIGDNPQSVATLFSNGFALPKDVYDQGQQNYRTELNADTQSALNDARIKSAWDLAQYKQGYQRQQDAIKNALEERRVSAYENRGTSSGNSGNGGNEDKKVLKVATGASNMAKEIDSLIMNGNFDKAREKYFDFIEYMRNNQNTFYEGFSDEWRNWFGNVNGMFNDFFGVDEEEADNSDLSYEEQVDRQNKKQHELFLNYLIRQGMYLYGLSEGDARNKAMQILNQGKRNTYQGSQKNENNAPDYSQANKNVNEILGKG